MLNQVDLVGRVQDIKQEQERTIITINVLRPYENKSEYKSDILPIYLHKGIEQNIKELIKKNDLVNIVGRLCRVNHNDFTANGYPVIEILAEKVILS